MKSVAVAEGQRVADDGPENGDQAHHGEALHHGAEDVLPAHQAAVEKRQAGAGHQQHQRGRDQHPGVVAGGLGILDGLLQGGDLGLGGRGLCGWRLPGPQPSRDGPRAGRRTTASKSDGQGTRVPAAREHEVFRFEFTGAEAQRRTVGAERRAMEGLTGDAEFRQTTAEKRRRRPES